MSLFDSTCPRSFRDLGSRLGEHKMNRKDAEYESYCRPTQGSQIGARTEAQESRIKFGFEVDSGDDLKSLPLAEVEKKLGSSPGGLTQAEAEKRLTQYGPNELEEKKKIRS